MTRVIAHLQGEICPCKKTVATPDGKIFTIRTPPGTNGRFPFEAGILVTFLPKKVGGILMAHMITAVPAEQGEKSAVP